MLGRTGILGRHSLHGFLQNVQRASTRQQGIRALSATSMIQQDKDTSSTTFYTLHQELMPLLGKDIPIRAGPKHSSLVRLSQEFTKPDEIPLMQEAIRAWREQGRPIPGFGTRQVIQRLVNMDETELALEMLGDVTTYGMIPTEGKEVHALLRALCEEVVAETDPEVKHGKLQRLAKALAMWPAWNLPWDATAYDCLMRAYRFTEDTEEMAKRVVQLAEEAKARGIADLPTLVDNAVWAYRKLDNASKVQAWREWKRELTPKTPADSS